MDSVQLAAFKHFRVVTDTAYTQKMQKMQHYYESDMPSFVIEIIDFLLCHH